MLVLALRAQPSDHEYVKRDVGAIFAILHIVEQLFGLVLQVEREQVVVYRLILRVEPVDAELQVADGFVRLVVVAGARGERGQEFGRIELIAKSDPQVDGLFGQKLEKYWRIFVAYFWIVLNEIDKIFNII